MTHFSIFRHELGNLEAMFLQVGVKECLCMPLDPKKKDSKKLHALLERLDIKATVVKAVLLTLVASLPLPCFPLSILISHLILFRQISRPETSNKICSDFLVRIIFQKSR